MSKDVKKYCALLGIEPPPKSAKAKDPKARHCVLG